MSELEARPLVNLDEFQDGGAGMMAAESDSPGSSPLMPSKHDRVFKKAKRLVRLSPRKDEADSDGLTLGVRQPNGPGAGEPTRAPFTKNSRKSRNAIGRGLPKKGGAGGKGVWGAPGSELYTTSECQDEDDPNYDSDNQDAYVVKKIVPVLSVEELTRAVKPVIQEYLEHGDSAEVIAMLSELNIGPSSHRIPEVAINLALDRHDPQRELTSRLISDMYGCLVCREAMARGFDNLLRSLRDLVLDTPNAPELVGQFMARAVADDCLCPSFINSYRGKVTDDFMTTALEKAEILINMKHGMVHLDNIWGEGGANRPVKYLTNQMVSLLKEYLNSGDITEATRCLQELDVPHFHHELVYNAGMIAIEDMSDRASDMMVALLKSLTASLVITPEMLTKGIHRLCEDMEDISLDVPAAFSLFDRLGNKLHEAGVISEQLMKELPTRGRKRFVSEGDGGKVKETLLNGH